MGKWIKEKNGNWNNLDWYKRLYAVDREIMAVTYTGEHVKLFKVDKNKDPQQALDEMMKVVNGKVD